VTATAGDVIVDAAASGDIRALVASAAVSVAAGAVGVGVSIGVGVARNLIGYKQSSVANVDHSSADEVNALTKNSTTVRLEGGVRGRCVPLYRRHRHDCRQQRRAV